MRLKIGRLLAMAALAGVLLTVTCGAEYYAYPVYGYEKDLDSQTVSAAPGYGPTGTIGGGKTGDLLFSTPSDITIDRDICYIADTGNSRVVALDVSGTEPVTRFVLAGFIGENGEEDALNQPQGVCLAGDELYVADTQNSRIVIFDRNGAYRAVIPAPAIDVFALDTKYHPAKIGVDSTGRIFVACLNVTDGLVQLDRDGQFIRFFGSNRVKVSLFERFLSLFLSKQQRTNRFTPTPIEYNNLTIDEQDFIYTTTSNTRDYQVKRLNTQGNNILTRILYGDSQTNKQPNIVDAAVDGDRNLFVLDQQFSRVFQYNHLGDLLQIFGGPGDAAGAFKGAAALDCTADGRVFVVDAVKNNITIFAATEFGALVNEANRLYVQGRYPEALETWAEILRRDANYTLAYVGMGHALRQENRLGEALYYYKKGDAREDYSLVYEDYRGQRMNGMFPYLISGAIVLLVGMRLLRTRRRRLFAKLREFVDP